MTDSMDYYEEEDYDSVYANNSILELANVKACLQNESLDELLKKDQAKVKNEDGSCAWYHSKISRESAESLLREGLSKLGTKDGLFLVRDSTSSEGDFVLSVTHNSRVFQFHIKEIYDGYYRLDEGPIVQGLEKLILYYHGESTGLITKLTHHCQGSAPPPKSRNMGPITLLHRAVLEGDENIVEKILKHPLCPDINGKNEWGTTALHDCCKYGFTKIAELLVTHTADVHMKDKQGLTPLHRACAANRPEMIPVLIMKGQAKTQMSSPKTSWVPMHDAAMRGYVDCIKELLRFHAPMWPRAEDEQTPLDLAIKYHRGSCVQLLKADDKRPVRTRKEHWYHPNIVRQQAYDLLEDSNKMDGLFLVRPSNRAAVHAVITFCHKRNNYNFEVKTKDYTNANKTVYYIDNGPYFESMERLIEHYSRQADGMTTRLTASINTNGDTIPVEKDNDYYNLDDNGSKSQKSSIASRLTGVLSSIVSDKHVGFMRAPTKTPNIPQNVESDENLYAQPVMTTKSSSPPPPLPNTHRPPKQPPPAKPTPLAETKQPSVDKTEVEFKKIIDNKEIKLGNALGEGEFGEVRKATYSVKDGLLRKKKIDVAVKTFRQNEAGAAAFESINREAILMQDLDHTCIVRLYGICQQPFMLVEEFVAKGALSDYLVKKKVEVDPTLYLWASQIASGMQYLESKKIVHRDLAARNILVESEKQCKISDFGLSRAYEDESNYYKASKGGRWPIKWYAPECVNFGKFTHATDVWSYGVTLWEMFSYGDQPYDDMKGIEVIQYVESGKRLQQPKDCPDVVYQKMLACWKKDPKERLTFDDLHRHFQDDPMYASALDVQRIRKGLSSSVGKK